MKTGQNKSRTHLTIVLTIAGSASVLAGIDCSDSGISTPPIHTAAHVGMPPQQHLGKLLRAMKCW